MNETKEKVSTLEESPIPRDITEGINKLINSTETPLIVIGIHKEHMWKIRNIAFWELIESIQDPELKNNLCNY